MAQLPSHLLNLLLLDAAWHCLLEFFIQAQGKIVNQWVSEVG